MTVKDYLYSVRVSDKLIRTKEHELSKLRLNIAQVSVKQNEPVKTSGVNDPMRIVDRIADLQAEINREIDNLVRLKTEIRSKINALDDYRYIAILTVAGSLKKNELKLYNKLHEELQKGIPNFEKVDDIIDQLEIILDL